MNKKDLLKKIRIYLKKFGLDIRKYQLRPMNYFMKEYFAKKGLIGIEIGVEYGEHALETLKNLNIKRIYLIDPYSVYDDYQEGIQKIRTKENQTNAKKFARRLLKKYKDKIVWINKKSEDASKDVSEKVDFVYIDGNHEYNFVKKDIEKYSPLVKRRGIIGGHDFRNYSEKGGEEIFGVFKAVMGWILKRKGKLFVNNDWWIIKNEKN